MVDNRDLTRLNVRIPTDLQEWFKNEASRLGVPMAALVIIGLQQYKQQQEAMTMFKVPK